MNTSDNRTIEDSKEGRDFEKLVLWVSTASIAVMAGFLASIKQVNPAIQFQFSALSVVAFFVGGAVAAIFLRIVLHGNKRRRALLVLAAAILSMLGYFVIGINKSAQANRHDVVIGTAIAAAVLSFVAWVLWRVSRFFEADQEKNAGVGK